MSTYYCPYCGAQEGSEHKKSCRWFEAEIHVTKPLDINMKENLKSIITRQKAAELLAHTSELINGERARDYGEPQQSFEKIAELWSTYLHQPISVTDVGMMMILLKVARNGRGKDKDDNFVDICGYASLAGSAVFKGK